MTAPTHRDIDGLEHRLRTEPIVDVYERNTATSHTGQLLVIFASGLEAIVKPADPPPPGPHDDGERLVHGEVAAWIVLRGLGWEHLMPVTVLRTLQDDTGADVLCSVQEVIPAGSIIAEKRLPVGVDQLDKTKAGIFDYLIQHCDRWQNNWAIVNDGGRKRIRLFDHGRAFGYPQPVHLSTFVALLSDVPDDLKPAIVQLIRSIKGSPLEMLLPPLELAALRRRARDVLALTWAEVAALTI